MIYGDILRDYCKVLLEQHCVAILAMAELLLSDGTCTSCCSCYQICCFVSCRFLHMKNMNI